jgi:hypothetical protein
MARWTKKKLNKLAAEIESEPIPATPASPEPPETFVPPPAQDPLQIMVPWVPKESEPVKEPADEILAETNLADAEFSLAALVFPFSSTPPEQKEVIPPTQPDVADEPSPGGVEEAEPVWPVVAPSTRAFFQARVAEVQLLAVKLFADPHCRMEAFNILERIKILANDGIPNDGGGR